MRQTPPMPTQVPHPVVFSTLFLDTFYLRFFSIEILFTYLVMILAWQLGLNHKEKLVENFISLSNCCFS